MSYNLMAVSTDKISFSELNSVIIKYNKSLEYIPMPISQIVAKDSLGISIPTSKVNNDTWNEIVAVFDILSSNFKMKIYDLYSGKEITKDNYNLVKDSLL